MKVTVPTIDSILGDKLERFDNKKSLNDYSINAKDYQFLNKTSKLPNKALFYWYHAIELFTSLTKAFTPHTDKAPGPGLINP
ncbi:MAG: hypothetical protein PVH88_22725 [Ignavibacteria bacterium]